MANSFATTTVILTRHGERIDTDPADFDPHLNEAGKARAQTLAHVLGSSGINAIYTSHFTRTKETAHPLATQLGLTTIQIDEADKIRADILSKHIGETVLVIGHSNSVPELINQLGGTSLLALEDKEFDNLFVVTLFNSGKAGITKLKYGDPS